VWWGEFIIATSGAVVGAGVSWLMIRASDGVTNLAASRTLAVRLSKAGITKFHLSREDYPNPLPAYLSQAQHSIEMVSVSLKLKDDEGGIVALFRQQLARRQNLRIGVSLLAPRCPASAIMAEVLGTTHDELARDIVSVLERLVSLRESLPDTDRARLRICVHEKLPIGSGILLDATPNSGTIQVDTKMYLATRGESFGYELKSGGAFYERHFRAYRHVLDSARVVDRDVLRGLLAN
jgi:hypothetical protein